MLEYWDEDAPRSTFVSLPVPAGTDQELPDNLAQVIQDRGDILIATYLMTAA